MRLIILLAALTFSFSVTAQTKKSKTVKYDKLPSGLRYKIIEDSLGASPVDGGAIFFDMTIYGVKSKGKDTLLREHMPNAVLVSGKFEKGSLEEGFFLLSKGDSAIFLINLDSFFTFQGQPKPDEPVFKGVVDLKFIMKVTKVLTPKEVMELQSERAKERKAQAANTAIQIEEYKQGLFIDEANKVQIEKDQREIEDYLAKNNIKAEYTHYGVHYVITRKGTGALHAIGDSISVNYKGILLDGTVFDSNEGGAPFVFIYGVGQVILGWDEVMAILRVGDKATIYIPSILAYGSQAQGKIPANANLIFEVEILK